MPPTRSKVSPILSWPDERGYALSDRIWNISEATAAQIDALLQEAISSGMQSTALAKRLEQFLLPGRTLPQTTTPYGTTGSYNARRLARSEITRAHSLATKAAGIANPFVDKMFYNLSNSHVADGDICEEYAALSDSQGGFDPAECPVPEADTHPHCLCFLTSGTMSQEDAIALINDGVNSDQEAAFTEDGSVDLFTLALWGSAVWDVFNRLFG